MSGKLAGNASLLGVLLQHYDSMKRHLKQRFGDADFAADVVQDLCVRVLEGKYDEKPAAQGAFLRHVSHQLAIDTWRADSRRATHLDSAADVPELTDIGASPEDIMTSRQTGAQLLDAVNALSPRCRDVFVLVHLNEMTQHEAARTLGISRGMVARYVAQANAALAPILSPGQAR